MDDEMTGAWYAKTWYAKAWHRYTHLMHEEID